MLSIDTDAGGAILCFPVNPNTPTPAHAPLSDTRAIAIIPARYDSLRLPGKPLRLIGNLPLIIHTARRANTAKTISRVIIATDDTRIKEACERENFVAVMTNANHKSGTDRIAEAAAILETDGILETEDPHIIVNVQGDEPLIAPQTIDRAVQRLYEDAQVQVATTCERIEHFEDVMSPDVVKVVMDENHHALYFSRSPIPFPRELVRSHGSLEAALKHEPAALNLFRKHTGLYAYRREFLLEYVRLPQSTLELTESLEQLRVLQRGFRIGVVEVEDKSIGIDTEADLIRVQKILESQT